MTDLSIDETDFIAVDFETTGFSPEQGDVVELAAIKFNLNEGEKDLMVQLIRPRFRIPPDATAVHGITNEMVARQPMWEEYLPYFERFIGDGPLICHNASFEKRFSKGLFVQRPMICTLKLARRHLPGRRSYALGSLVPFAGWHRAHADTKATVLLFRQITERIREQRSGKSIMLHELLTNG